jgi:hypothetical protein
MSKKIYCKDCRFYSDTLGTCHKFPPQPMFDIHNKSMGHPYVCDNDWCGMAEKKSDATYQARPANEIFISISENGNKEPRINDIPLGTFIANLQGKANDLEAENNRLRGLIAEIRDFLIEGAVPGRFHLKQECIREIYTIGRLEDQKRREEK